MIIIETTTRERLVLVPEERIVCTEHARDATPADMERAGYVPSEEMPEALRRQRDDWQRKAESLLARAEKAEREREECESVLTAMGARAREAEEFAREREDERDTLRAELADAKAECQGAMLSAYAQYAETVRERDEARSEVARLTAPAEGEPTPGQILDACPPAGGIERLLACYRLGVAHERARCAAAGVTVATADEAALFEVVEQPEMLPPDNSRILSSGLTEAVEVDLMGIVDTAIGRLDSYGASLVCRGSASGAAHSVALDAYRLGVAHERARQQPAQDRATDEELGRAYSAAYARAWESEVSTPDRGERAGVLAVAARVRQERCLVAQAVEMGEGLSVTRRATGAEWRIRLVGGPGATCDAADVPATLARLLGEVERG